ncbi:sugar transferase [Bradyrhizobium sp. Ai1a-2]|uniref:sugar transferase n=1 Tax=Bradyrhizobium sp. Ai1a-2 TaxID=196490 RepID=UPI000A06FFDB|nr:sugar transferase [Bradyrhizobium sp. Ai1a-2]
MGLGPHQALSRPSNQNVENNPMQSSNHAFRHPVKPGYRGETRTVGMMEKRVELNLWYINNWSLWLDVRILLATATSVFGQSTAY